MDFTSLSWELWLALGVALLAAEALGASGFLIGAAVAALANAVLVWLMPEMSSTAQVVIYSVSAVIATIVYFQVFRDAQRTSSRPNLNKRTAKLVGTRFYPHRRSGWRGAGAAGRYLLEGACQRALACRQRG